MTRAKLQTCVVFLVACATYACTLGGTFVYDDVGVITSDPRMSHPALWGRFFTAPYVIGGVDKLFRPLTSLSLAIQYTLQGHGQLWLFHLVNVLLHASVACMVAALGRRLSGTSAGWVGGLLFAVHPIHVEAVAELVNRAELICALAILGGIYLFFEPLTSRRVLAIAGCFVVALLSKEQGILFPLILLAAYPLRRSMGAAMERKSIMLLLILLCWLLGVYLAYREEMIGMWWERSRLMWELNPMVLSTGRNRWLMPLVLLGHYAQLLAAPVKLSLDYGGNVIGWQASFRDPYLYAGIAVAGSWIALAAWSLARRRWTLVFLLAGLALSYGLVGNAIALIGTIMGERLMYLPSAFFLLLVAALVVRLPRAAVIPLVVAGTILGACQSIAYARRWNHPVAFYEWSRVNQPKSEQLDWVMYGQYARRKDWKDALRVAEDSLANVPQSAESHGMYVQALMKLGRYRAALSAADAALERFPRNMSLRSLWGQASAKLARARQQ